MRTAYLSLGSNIEAPANIASAMRELEQAFENVEFSQLYQCPAVGFDGDDFINLVARVDTDLPPLDLKRHLSELENSHHRDRSAERWSSRTLDIDILLYGDLVLYSPELEIPRDEILAAAHVLRPLADLAPGLIHPVEGKTITALWQDFPPDQDSLTPFNF